MSKVAIIIETRKHKALEFVLNNVMSNLPDEWKLQIFHGIDNIEYIQNIINNNSLLSSIKNNSQGTYEQLEKNKGGRF